MVPSGRLVDETAKSQQTFVYERVNPVMVVTVASAKCHTGHLPIGPTLALRNAVMMLAYRLVRLIENHSDALAATLVAKVQNSELVRSYRNVPASDLKEKVGGIYGHLGEWLLGKSSFDIEQRYEEIGATRVHQGVPVSELVWVIILTKESLWEFLQKESTPERPDEAFGELELLQLLDQFFDRAIYYATVGYERALAAQNQRPTRTATR